MRIYIRAMSEDRRNIQSELKSHSEQLDEHIIRLMLYPNSDYVSHWKQEIWNLLHKVDKLKGKHQFPKASFIYDAISTHNDMIKEFRELVEDIESELTPVDVSTERIIQVLETYQRWVAEMLSVRGIVRRSEVYAKLDELIHA